MIQQVTVSQLEKKRKGQTKSGKGPHAAREPHVPHLCSKTSKFLVNSKFSSIKNACDIADLIFNLLATLSQSFMFISTSYFYFRARQHKKHHYCGNNQ